MTSDISYPTKIDIPDGICDAVSEFFQKKGWTYGIDKTVTPQMIEDNIKELVETLQNEKVWDEMFILSSGRLSLIRRINGDTMEVDMYLDLGTLIGIPYDSSPTTKIQEKDK